jgi:hypothetical protein
MDAAIREITVMQDHFMSLRERVSDARKQGINTKIPEVKLMNLQSKIQMANITGKDKDLNRVKEALADIENEMKQLRREESFERMLRQAGDSERQRLKEEEHQTSYLKLSQREIIEKTNKLIKQASEYLDTRKFEKVYPIYREIQEIYKYLPRELKQEVYQDSMHIFSQLQKSEIFKTKRTWKTFFIGIWRRFRK